MSDAEELLEDEVAKTIDEMLKGMKAVASEETDCFKIKMGYSYQSIAVVPLEVVEKLDVLVGEHE